MNLNSKKKKQYFLIKLYKNYNFVINSKKHNFFKEKVSFNLSHFCSLHRNKYSSWVRDFFQWGNFRYLRLFSGPLRRTSLFKSPDRDGGDKGYFLFFPPPLCSYPCF